MIFFLIIGIVLGALSVLFILQNVTPVMVTFLTWHIDGSLALILLAAMASGVVVTLLILLPSFIKDDMYLSVLKKQKKEMEDELEKYKLALGTQPPPPSQIL